MKVPVAPPTPEEAHALEERARTGAAAATRPTQPPFPWADEFSTIGVTGTNGKTSTTWMIEAMLREAYGPCLSETTIGYRIGDETIQVPRTVGGYLSAFFQAYERGVRHAAVEVTSEGLARGFARLWRIDVGVFTNLTHDHLSKHGSWEHYLASKAQLFVHLGPGRTAVFNAADPHAELLDQVTPPDVARLWYAAPSRGPALRRADLASTGARIGVDGTTVDLVPSEIAERLGGALGLRFVGDVFAENALGAACAGLSIGLSPENVRRGLAECRVTPGRFEVISRDPIAVVDYAHTPDALGRACDTARGLCGAARLLVVFGAGGNRDKDKREPMGRKVGERAHVAIVTNDNPRDEDPKRILDAVAAGARRGGRAHVQIEPDRRRAIERAFDQAKAGDIVLIAGKGHERGQEIRGRTLPFSDVDEVRRLTGARCSE
jgi:UDP-N-acetylmuramoyl-L-alanyl-D-glutamate--2,6-diaminopimelate ligase